MGAALSPESREQNQDLFLGRFRFRYGLYPVGSSFETFRRACWSESLSRRSQLEQAATLERSWRPDELELTTPPSFFASYSPKPLPSSSSTSTTPTSSNFTPALRTSTFDSTSLSCSRRAQLLFPSFLPPTSPFPSCLALVPSLPSQLVDTSQTALYADHTPSLRSGS